MTAFLLPRLGQTILVLVGVSIIVFGLIHFTPGDPVDVIFAGENISEAQKDEYRAQLGLDRPLPVQYVEFATAAARGDLGTSIRRQVPVTTLIGAALPATIELTLAALLVALVIAVPIAIVSGLRPGSVWDRSGSLGALFGISMPSFWLGIMLILLFSVTLRWLPPTGRLDIGTGLGRITGLAVLDAVLTGNTDGLRSALLHIALPAVTLGTAVAATIARVLRSGLLEVRGQDYVDALQARGLSASRVVRHMVRNALPPTITVLGVRIGTLLGGAIVVEMVFSWPGLGRLIVDAVRARDYPTVQGAVLVMAVVFVLVNLVADMLYAWLDPRVRAGRKASA
jgi:ABC-type dipeptide/oligopeptide/nickel transport system permease component